MGSECVLTAEQLELLTSSDSRVKLPSLSGEQCNCWAVWDCSFQPNYVPPTSSLTHACPTLTSSSCLAPYIRHRVVNFMYRSITAIRFCVIFQLICPSCESRQLSLRSQLRLHMHSLHASRHEQCLPPSNVDSIPVITCVSSAGDNGQRLLTPSKEDKLRALVNGLDR